MNFSQRMGLEPVLPILQIDRISTELRNSLWNLLYEVSSGGTYTSSSAKRIWGDFFKLPLDELAIYSSSAMDQIKKKFMAAKWHAIYDLFEFILNNFAEFPGIRISVNAILARESSGFRLVERRFVPISDAIELSAIHDAISSTRESFYSNIHEHLKTAISLLAKKPTPDYRNSIKESISAVEGLCKVYTGESSGGIDKAIAKLAKQISLHSQMEEGFKNLYNYTSGKDGIRHPILEQSNVGLAEAKYMLVVCSAFVHFVVMKTEVKSQT
jgi:hypothetical protein